MGEKGNEFRGGLVKFEMFVRPPGGGQLLCERELAQLGERRKAPRESAKRP